MVFGRNPDKLETKALDYERRGKTAKALKCREKAARLRGTTSSQTGNLQTFQTNRTPQRYEQNALKWEQRGNWQKAQKNREKVWRLQNPQYGPQYAAPSFYDTQNRFLGYNNGLQQQGFQQQGFQQQGFQQQGFQQHAQGASFQHVMPATVETHTHATVIEQTMRPEKIVEVQPVIHRQVDAPQVHVIEKHMYEQVRSTGPNVITNAAIVEETVRPRIIEEIQPVVHREVPAPFVERVEQHVTEHITQPTTMTKEIQNDPTIRGPGIAAGGGPLQQQQGLGMQQHGMGQQQGMHQQQGLGMQQQGSNLPQQSNLGKPTTSAPRR